MAPILINKDVFEPSYNDLRFMAQNSNYVCTNLINKYSYCGKQYRGSSKNEHMIQQSHIWVYIWRRLDVGIPRFIEVLFTIAKIWKQSKCTSADKWIKKIVCVCVCVCVYVCVCKNGILFSHEKKEILPYAPISMDLKSILLSWKK